MMDLHFLPEAEAGRIQTVAVIARDLGKIFSSG